MIRVFGWQTSTAGEFDFRIGQPFPLLDPTRFDATWGTPPPDIHDFDVVFAHRLAGRSDLWHDLCHDPGVLTVYDMDDDLLCIDRTNTIPFRVYAPQAPETLRNVQAADVVTVSSPGLLERYSQIHPHVVYLPICIPDDLPDWPVPERAGLTVGWAGSMHKRQDWPGIPWVLREFGERFPEARFRMYGADYTGGLLGQRCEFIPFNPDVQAFWRGIDLDVGIAPMVDTLFNAGKCHTKLIEYGARRIPCVASPIGQYPEWIDHGVNGFIAHERGDWVRYLTELTDKDRRADMATAAWESAKEWTFGKHIHRWEQVFSGEI